ncbi:MAG TPA: PAS domain S-box protein [Cyclobacteriaceae bacterium]|jgi:PAS domain S-box-containing protein|nr:PAS domain S-box protein [Cyclobacteriaceae bacterium]
MRNKTNGIEPTKRLESQYARSLIEASLDPLVTISTEGKITDMNEALANITGMPREKLTGTDFFDYFTEPQKAREVYQEVFAKGSVADSPLTLRHKNGKLTDVLFNGSVYKDDRGNVLGVVIVARDVTAQKLLSKYSLSLIEASLDPLVTISTEGKITDMNQATVNITGITREKLTGTDFFDYFTEPQKAREVYQEVFAKGSVADSPLTLRHKNGKLTDVLFNGSVYKDDRGNVLGVVIVARDVTAQKLLSKYSLSLIEASLDPLVTISTEGKITDMNEALANITGITREKLTGTDFFDYFTEPQKAREVYQEVFAKGSVADSPLTLRHKDGKLTDVLFNGSVYKDDRGNVLGVVIVARDVTAQKLLSKYSLSLIEASLDPLVTISTEGKITDMNQATVNITGITREKLTGTDFFDYFTEPQKAREVYQEVFAKGSVADSPLTLRHKDGKLTDVLFNGSVYKDDRGNVLGVVIVARDVTDQKIIATELTEAKVFAELATGIAEEAKSKAESATRTAEDAVKAKQQFLSNMSHEIRTPMNAIIGFTKVVLKTNLSAKQKEYLTAIKMSGDALIVLINDILDLAKVDAGKMTFEQTPFKMALSISTMLHLFETKIQEKNLMLIKTYDNNIPEVLVGDPVRLHQIILNLVSNAVKFTTKGKITVRVQLLDEDEEKATIEFAVMDTGIGIAKDKIETIFENFQQASSGTARLYGGTGLGLAIVKQLVEGQGGSIRVQSKIDEGSTFSFILSFHKTKAEAESETGIVELDAEIKNIKVLVVEDIPLNQLLMKTLLDEFGFERDIAANGKIAIEKLETKSYDIILMDLQMPEMNGFEATEYIRNKMNSKIPIIALTADVTTVDLAKCKAAGMNDYIAKPVDERLLYSKIVGLVKKPMVIKYNDHEVNGNGQSQKLKCIDLAYILRLTKGDSTLMMEMFSVYLKQTPPLIGAMKQSWQDKDWRSLYAAVHKMIPSFSVMGMNPEFEGMAKRIQEFASTQQQTEEIPELVLQLENVCMQACKELEEEFTAINNAN